MEALRGNGSRHFFKTFYKWSQLNSSAAAHGRRHISLVAEQDSPDQTKAEQESRGPKLRMFIPAWRARMITADDSKIINDIRDKFAIDIEMDGVPPASSKSWRIVLYAQKSATESSMQQASQYITSLRGNKEGEDVGNVPGRLDVPGRPDLPDRPDLPATRPSRRPLGRPVIPPTRSRRNEALEQQPLTTKPMSKEKALEVQVLNSGFKNIMRSAASNVCVLAIDLLSGPLSATATTHPKFWNLRGMTLSSMSSVSLDPNPVVSFNIRRPSRTLDAILEAKVFTANFLAPTDKGAKIAHAFTKPHDDPSQPFRTLYDSRIIDIHGNPRSGPKLISDAVSARLRCRFLKSVTVNDHTVLFANVTHTRQNNDDTFLAYAQGRYRRLSTDIVDPSSTTEKDDDWSQSETFTFSQPQNPSFEHTKSPPSKQRSEETNFADMYYRMAENDKFTLQDNFLLENDAETKHENGKQIHETEAREQVDENEDERTV